MAGKNLSYFMRPELKNEEVVEVPGPDSIKDESGNAVIFQIKRLTQERINKIYDNYRTEKVAMDKRKKQPYIVNGKVVMQETMDNRKAYRHVIAEALVYPDLRDKDLMEYYGCADVTDMPLKAFTASEYDYIGKIVNQVLGLGEADGGDHEDDDLEEAKN